MQTLKFPQQKELPNKKLETRRVFLQVNPFRLVSERWCLSRASDPPGEKKRKKTHVFLLRKKRPICYKNLRKTEKNMGFFKPYTWGYQKKRWLKNHSHVNHKKTWGSQATVVAMICYKQGDVEVSAAAQKTLLEVIWDMLLQRSWTKKKKQMNSPLSLMVPPLEFGTLSFWNLMT